MPRPLIDLTGRTFGRLTVVGRANKVAWHCNCACGGTHTVRGDLLRDARVTHCGCMRHIRRKPIRVASHGAETARPAVVEIIDCPTCHHQHPWTMACPWCCGRVRGFVADGPLVGVAA